MSAANSRVRALIGWLLRRYMPLIWAWLVFGQQTLVVLTRGGA
jgi:hypothetical protein